MHAGVHFLPPFFQHLLIASTISHSFSWNYFQPTRYQESYCAFRVARFAQVHLRQYAWLEWGNRTFSCDIGPSVHFWR